MSKKHSAGSFTYSSGNFSISDIVSRSTCKSTDIHANLEGKFRALTVGILWFTLWKRSLQTLPKSDHVRTEIVSIHRLFGECYSCEAQIYADLFMVTLDFWHPGICNCVCVSVLSKWGLDPLQILIVLISYYPSVAAHFTIYTIPNSFFA